MKTLLCTLLTRELEQHLPIFFEAIGKLDPKPGKMVAFDFFEQNPIDKTPLSGIAEVRSIERKENLLSQFQEARNLILKEAQKENFDAVLFIQPDIIPPQNILERLFSSNKNIVAPTYFFFWNGKMISNAFRAQGATQGLQSLENIPFNALLPSGVHKVFSVSPECLFVGKKLFSKLDFSKANSPLDEIAKLSLQVQNAGEEIFVDSSCTCAKMSAMQLLSYYYFAAKTAFDSK